VTLRLAHLALRGRYWAGAAALGLGFAVAAAPMPARADGASHGLSTFGELKYPADFAHFDYVKPDAPKGGRISTIGTLALTTFDSFNGFILKGDPAQGIGFVFDSLMTRALDEPDAVYGLVARSATVAPDRLSVTFHLRPEAKFADGTALTAEDVAFSFQVLKEKGHPSIRQQMRDVKSAEAVDTGAVRYTFTGTQTRDLPLLVAGLPIFSKAFYATREFDQTTLEPPLGSGPYAVGEFRQGAFVTYRRRNDYWARDLNVNRGKYNFDEIRYEYFRDRTPGLEALKAGTIDLREEFLSKDWATAYDISQVKDGRILLVTLPDENPSGAQGFFLNTRRSKFADVRVRKALGMVFDFEWSNKNLFYGLYTRTETFFENSDMKATGVPAGEELALLELFRDRLATEVFGEPLRPPVSDGSGADRRLLRDAARLLDEAGWVVKDGKRTNAKGETFDIEFMLTTDPSFERIVAPYVKNLQAIGVSASIRRADAAQYERRRKAFDFDVVTSRFVLRLTPGLEVKNFWSSEAAGFDGSFNLAGIADPVVDSLLEKVIGARSRGELVTATRALDRVLRAGHYWVPHWYKAAHHVAYWDKFSRPAVKPKYDRGILETWWYDTEKAAKLKTN
jgi:microcin C transport system substrate-binding protein